VQVHVKDGLACATSVVDDGATTLTVTAAATLVFLAVTPTNPSIRGFSLSSLNKEQRQVRSPVD
jgi:hypothetical protein